MTQRIQRKRSKGWVMPEGVVYVGRPTKWGNPFEVGKDGDRDRCIRLYELLAGGALCISKPKEHVEAQRKARKAMEDAAVELRGKDLACWCRLDQKCHADVLLEIANAGERAE